MAIGSVNVPGASAADLAKLKKEFDDYVGDSTKIILHNSTTELPEVVEGAILITYDDSTNSSEPTGPA